MEAYSVVYAMFGLATANSNTRCLMTGSTDLNPRYLIEVPCWELHRKFYCQFSVGFRQRAEVPIASICTNEIYVYTEFGHPFGYPWFVHEFCLDRFNTCVAPVKAPISSRTMAMVYLISY
jgi:hypothetical protein